jgi:Ni/Fe-hydrogenase 1 B-type cytochrome subunit
MEKKDTAMEKRTPVREWTVPVRVHHWAMALSVFFLIVTGWYIADPFSTSSGETVHKFLMGDMRYYHLLFGVILTILFVWRMYMGFFERFHAKWENFLAITDWKNFVKQIKFYLLVSNERPDHVYLYGPLQALSYMGLFVMIFFIVITGLILTGAGYHHGLLGLAGWILTPVERLVGGLAMVRYVHHILTWLFVLFIIVHIYMAFWYDIVFKEGTVSSMINGMVFKAKEH